MIVSRFYDIILYKYNTDAFKKLNLRDLEDPILKDQDLLWNTANFQKYYNEANTLVPTGNMPSNLRNLLLENYALQRIQAENADHLSWINATSASFWSDVFTPFINAKKEQLTEIIQAIVQNPDQYITRYLLTSNPILSDNNVNLNTSTQDSGISIDGLVTSIHELNNACMITLSSEALKTLSITVEENDVIEILETQWRDNNPPFQRPIFYGFVVSTKDSYQYGDIVNRAVSCFGLSKMLNLSRIVNVGEAASSAIYNEGSELDSIPISFYGNNYQNDTVALVFQKIMSEVLRLQGSTSAQSTDAASSKIEETSAYNSLRTLSNSLTTTLTNSSPGYEVVLAVSLRNQTYTWYSSLNSTEQSYVNKYYYGDPVGSIAVPSSGTVLDYLKYISDYSISLPVNLISYNPRTSTDNSLIPVLIKELPIEQAQATVQSPTFKASNQQQGLLQICQTYTQNIKQLMTKVQQDASSANAKYNDTVPNTNQYVVDYIFPYGSLNTPSTQSELKQYVEKLMPSLQVSAPLLLLYYLARQVLTFGDNTVTVDNEDNPGVIARYQGCGTQSYPAFETMLRTAWSFFYSTFSTPDTILNNLRANAFYEVFEDRPGVIHCRPPRYNIWFGDEISYDEVLEYSKTSNDAQLVSRSDYKFFTQDIGVQERYAGGHWTDSDILLKYGFRADLPKDNQNATTPVTANFWAALDLCRLNAETRTATITVPTTVDVKLGTLYYIPLQEGSIFGTVNTEYLSVKNSGIVGYVTSINTNIKYGDVATHTLELSYVRKAEKFIDYTVNESTTVAETTSSLSLLNTAGATLLPATLSLATAVNTSTGVERLNFYKLPDLETFMQVVQKNQDIATKEVPVTSQTTSNEAIKLGGVYWAVDPTVYDIFAKSIQSGMTDQIFKNLQKEHNLLAYVSPTDFKPEHFTNKDSGQNPTVLQETINRLWLYDNGITNTVTPGASTLISFPGYTNNVIGTINDAEIIKKLGLSKTDRISAAVLSQDRYVKVGEEHGPLAFVDLRFNHNKEYLGFSSSSASTDLLAVLDPWIESEYVNTENTIKISSVPYKLQARYTSDPHNIGCSGKSLYYTTNSLGARTLSVVAIGLTSIPISKRFTIQNIANCNGLIGHKSFSDAKTSEASAKDEASADETKYDHLLGVQVDIVPDFLQYWTLNEANSVISAQPVGTGTVVPERTESQPVVFTNVASNRYIKFSLDPTVVSSLALSSTTLSKALELEFKKSTASTEQYNATNNAPLKKFDSSIYDLNQAYDVYHVKLAASSAIIGNASVQIKKRVYFSIKYKGSSDTAQIVPKSKLPVYDATTAIFNKIFTDLVIADTILPDSFLSSLTASSGLVSSSATVAVSESDTLKNYLTNYQLTMSGAENTCYDEQQTLTPGLTVEQVLAMRKNKDVSVNLIDSIRFKLVNAD